MKTNTTLFYLGFFLVFMLCFSACRKDVMFKDGKRIYSSKAENITVLSGESRIQIDLAIDAPEVKKAVIYWDNRKESKEIAIDGNGLYTVLLENLAEGDYSFEVITYDSKGNSSSPVTVIGTAYGSNYSSTLLNTQIKDVIYENGTATITWGSTRQNSLSTELVYTDNNNTEQTLTIPLTATETKLENFKPGIIDAFFKYRTLYKPAGSTLDNVYSDYDTVAVITANLKTLATAKNINFGSLISYGGAATHGVINDGSPNGIYTQICSNEFNIGQAAWGATRWKQNPPSDFNDANAVINWCRPRYDKVTLIGLVGPNNYMPSWFREGTFTPTEMDDLLKSLVNEIMQSNDNKSKVDVWCVANELFNEDGTYRTMKWNDMGWEEDASGLTGTDQINTKHPLFIGKALQYCREKTNALLELRDYGIENDGTGTASNKYKAFYELIKHLKAKAYPVDVVGLQSHVMIGKGTAVGTAANMNADAPAVGYDNFKSAIRKYKEAGVKVYLTELDIVSTKINSQLQSWNPQLATQQKQDYYHFVKAAIESGVDLISLWGVRDDNDPGWRFGQNPLLFDQDYHKKPAYYGVQKALYEAVSH